MTLLVCSTCQTTLPADSHHCLRCGPQSLTLIISEEPAAGTAIGEMDVARRLLRALGSQYELVKLLGRGGFAEVFEVRDTELRRRLAVKVLRPDIAWTSGMLARFKQEARAIARLSHPHTVPIHFVGEGEGLVFYAMPFVEGRPLAQLLREEGALPPERAVALVLPILDALEHAHQHGLVHRDIKPDNVMIEHATGRPLLVDFGIAKSLDGESPSHTQDGFVVGTPLYMSPEQALGHRNVDARTDIYAVGAVLFQMLTGAPPFDGDSSQEIVSKHLTEPVPVPSLRNARIPRWLSDVILRAMAKRAADRYPSAAAMAEALRASQPTGAFEVVTAQRVVQQLRTDAPMILPPDESPPISEATTAKLPSGVGEHRVAPRRARRFARSAVVALLFAAVALGGAYALRPRANLVVTNRLVEPVSVIVDGQSHLVPPGDSVRLSLARTDTLHAEWRLERPNGPSGPLGVPLGGPVVQARPRGDVYLTIDAALGGRRYFAPIIRNGSSTPLSVSFTGEGAHPCDCRIAPGELAAHLGYYPLAPDASIRLTDTTGRTAIFGGLNTRLAATTGAVQLSVGDTDLPPPPAPPPPALPRARVHSGSAVRHLVPPADSAPAAPPRKDPLKGIFPGQP